MTPNERYVIGLTGGIACGKTTVAGMLRDMGQSVLDADAISRQLTAPGGAALGAIREAFGEAVFDGSSLNRRALADIVFADAAARKRLEGIIHPAVIQKMEEATQALTGLVFWDVPLLYEVGMDALCREVWCAYVSRREQLRRLTRRDGLTRAQAIARIDSQMPLAVKKSRAAHVINTSGDHAATKKRVERLLTEAQRRIALD